MKKNMSNKRLFAGYCDYFDRYGDCEIIIAFALKYLFSQNKKCTKIMMM